MQLIWLALPCIGLSKKVSPTNDSQQVHVDELMGFFLMTFAFAHASSCSSPPVLHVGHARRLHEEQVPLERLVVGAWLL